MTFRPTRPRRPWRALAGAGAAVALAVVLLAVRGCSAERDSAGGERRVTQIAEPDDVLGEELMLYLAQAKNLHHIADVYLGDGKVAEAIDSVRKILAIPVPKDAPEAEDVRADARAKLAKLLLLRGSPDEAMRTIDEGLAEVHRESFFVSNLHSVKGEILQAMAEPLDAASPEAHTLKRQAIEAYQRSLEMQEALQKRLYQSSADPLPGSGGAEGTP
jgi:tetratricopeptide (TPR) repeat protein